VDVVTKRELVDTLVNDYGVEDKDLTKKSVKELKEMLNGFKDKTQEQYVNEDVEQEKADKDSTVNENTVAEIQPKIYETIVRRFNPARDLKIENLGAGDVYVATTKENLIQDKNKIVPNQKVELDNVSVLYITSASRPIIRIIY